MKWLEKEIWKESTKGRESDMAKSSRPWEGLEWPVGLKT